MTNLGPLPGHGPQRRGIRAPFSEDDETHVGNNALKGAEDRADVSHVGVDAAGGTMKICRNDDTQHGVRRAGGLGIEAHR